MKETNQKLAFKKIIFFLHPIHKPVIMENVNDNVVAFNCRLFLTWAFIHYFAHGGVQGVRRIANAIICDHHDIPAWKFVDNKSTHLLLDWFCDL